MSVGIGDYIPLACVPSAIVPEERAAHFALIRKLFGEAAQKGEPEALPSGYAFRFPVDALELVARFVANERKCCPFLTFELVLMPDSESLWLRIFGPEGAREVLEAELTLPCACEVDV